MLPLDESSSFRSHHMDCIQGHFESNFVECACYAGFGGKGLVQVLHIQTVGHGARKAWVEIKDTVNFQHQSASRSPVGFGVTLEQFDVQMPKNLKITDVDHRKWLRVKVLQRQDKAKH